MALFGALIDLDGVIVDSDRYRFPSYNMALKPLGIEIAPEDIPLFSRLSVQEIVHMLEERHDVKFDLDTLAKEVRRFEIELMRGDHLETMDGIAPKAGLSKLIYELKRHQIPMAIATSSRKERAYAILDILGYVTANGLFKAIVCKEDVKEIKPSPDIDLMAYKRIGSPTYCIALEDSIEGIDAAKSAGLIAIAILPRSRSYEIGKYSKADLKISDISELSYAKLAQLVIEKGSHR